jgi:hypothetical protein
MRSGVANRIRRYFTASDMIRFVEFVGVSAEAEWLRAELKKALGILR